MCADAFVEYKNEADKIVTIEMANSVFITIRFAREGPEFALGVRASHLVRTFWPHFRGFWQESW